MATNLSIDPDLLERALEVSGERTKKAAVTKALQEFVARRRQKRLLELIGKLECDEAIHLLRMIFLKCDGCAGQARA
jgi:Arc/MetJ family transcription regulator